MSLPEIIERAGRLLSAAAPPGSTVIVFGSHARGDAGTESDLDFLVIEPEVAGRAREMVRLRDALDPLGIAADVIVVSAEHPMRGDGWRAASFSTRSPRGQWLGEPDLADLGRLLARKARSDEVVLEKLLDDREGPDDVLGFHAQQAVEKLLKAALAAVGVPPPRTHDLARLVALVEEAGLAPPPVAREARRLGPWAVEFRYDASLGESVRAVSWGLA